jgi:hypothetical protein
MRGAATRVGGTERALPCKGGNEACAGAAACPRKEGVRMKKVGLVAVAALLLGASAPTARPARSTGLR